MNNHNTREYMGKHICKMLTEVETIYNLQQCPHAPFMLLNTAKTMLKDNLVQILEWAEEHDWFGYDAGWTAPLMDEKAELEEQILKLKEENDQLRRFPPTHEMPDIHSMADQVKFDWIMDNFNRIDITKLEC